MPADISGNTNHCRNVVDSSATKMAPRSSVGMRIAGLLRFLPIFDSASSIAGLGRSPVFQTKLPVRYLEAPAGVR